MTPFRHALMRHAEATKVDATAVESHINKLLEWPHWPANIQDITADHINRWSNSVLYPAHRDERKLSPSTVQTRLSALKKAMQRAGVHWPVDVKKPQRSKRPKWVLSGVNESRIHSLLLNPDPVASDELCAKLALAWDYIQFTLETGLRVEEVLRVRWRHIHLLGFGVTAAVAVADALDRPVLEVMGTKTAASYDLIPVSSKALEVLTRRRETEGDGLLFPISYVDLRAIWAYLMRVLEVTDETATLKSLRRTFATRLAAKGIPTTILQPLMRHASLVTTSHYTNSVGLHEAAREWLN